MPDIIVIDGNSLINRAFYATPVLTNSKGQFTNAVYAFTNMLIRTIEDAKPKYLMVAFDMRAKTFRHLMYDGYKATRKGMPEELAAQMPLLHKLLEVMGIKVLEQEGIEADDILGTVAKKFDLSTVIVTGDRDAFQLIDETTSVWLTKRGITDIEEMDLISVKEKYGVEARQVVDYKALMGDSSDNIPGVKGIGEKTAQALIEKYDTIDNLYAHLDEISGKLREKLENGRESAYLSRALAEIKTDCNLDVTLEDMTYTYPFTSAVAEYFEELDFKTLAKKDKLFRQGREQRQAKIVSVPLTCEEELLHALEGVTDTVSFASVGEELHFAVRNEEEFVVKIDDSFLPDAFNGESVYRLLRPVWQNKEIKKVVYDVKEWYYRLAAYQAVPEGISDDVALKKYLCDFSQDPKSLKECLEQEGFPFEFAAVGLLGLNAELEARIEEYGMERLYREIELPLAFLLYEMERLGFRIDQDTLGVLENKYRAELDRLSAEIYEQAGERFNLNSTKQLSQILFDKLGLASGKKTKTGLSTNIEVLESIRDEHAIVPSIIGYRKISKLYSTYVEGLKGVVDAHSVVHTQFRQTLTTTGRLSSTEPNLQNIPVREDEGREIRKIFVKRDSSHILIAADYSQIELRLMAHCSGDEKMIQAFREGRDIHAATASEIFRIPPESLTPEQRRSAKAVNFGIIYGISDYGLANQLNISVKQAKQFIGSYFETYPKIKEYSRVCVESAKEKGYAQTMFGRRRRISELFSNNYNIRSFGERAAMNMPLQGTAADIIKLAMLRVDGKLREKGLSSRIILQVHDELILDACLSERQEVMRILKEEMENCVELSVPLTVNIACGDNWYLAKE